MTRAFEDLHRGSGRDHRERQIDPVLERPRVDDGGRVFDPVVRRASEALRDDFGACVARTRKAWLAIVEIPGGDDQRLALPSARGYAGPLPHVVPDGCTSAERDD